MDWKGIVSAVAPALGTALGGPLGGLAVSAVSDALLGRPNGTEGDIAVALKAGGPDALLKLKQADQAFAQRMRELDIDLERLHQSDRASARDREVKTGDAWTPRALAVLVLLAWVAVQWFLLTNVVPQEMREIVSRVLGTLDAALMMVLSYFFGSSSGSAAKNSMLAQK